MGSLVVQALGLGAGAFLSGICLGYVLGMHSMMNRYESKIVEVMDFEVDEE